MICATIDGTATSTWRRRPRRLAKVATRGAMPLTCLVTSTILPIKPRFGRQRTSSASAEPGAPRRKRCKTCAGCLMPQCGTCKFCLDMISRGGPGKLKKPCEKRICVEIGKSH
mmetsp:Transcript_4476/g.13238  ORF Transcript_4476/g.13238 Transcript_4476/m.13238 type:complete len:113 (-) Transcript_4476:37-375(-)